MAKLAIMAPLTHDWDLDAASSEDHQHLQGRIAERADCCAVAETDPAEPQVCQGSRAARRAARFHSVTSTCSTACGTQSELEALGSEGDSSLAGQVWLLSQDPAGCRQVQAALEAAPSDEAREALAEELHGHVAKAMRCPHANHVLQRCVALMRPETLQFIVDELLAREALVVQAAKHRYACRIVQQMLAKCPASQTAGLVEALVGEAQVLACHSIGHYTINLLLQLGTEDQLYRLVRAIERSMRSIALCPSGGAVVRSALSCAAPEDKIWIARAVFQDAEVLLALANERQGDRAILLVLKTLEEREREHERAREVLLKHVDMLRSSKFGHVVAEHLVSAGSPIA